MPGTSSSGSQKGFKRRSTSKHQAAKKIHGAQCETERGPRYRNCHPATGVSGLESPLAAGARQGFFSERLLEPGKPFTLIWSQSQGRTCSTDTIHNNQGFRWRGARFKVRGSGSRPNAGGTHPARMPLLTALLYPRQRPSCPACPRDPQESAPSGTGNASEHIRHSRMDPTLANPPTRGPSGPSPVSGTEACRAIA